MVREPFAADLPRSIELANTTFTTPRPLQEDGDECFERRNFERREREVASNFNVDAGDTERGFGWYVTPSLKPARRPHQNQLKAWAATARHERSAAEELKEAWTPCFSWDTGPDGRGPGVRRAALYVD